MKNKAFQAVYGNYLDEVLLKVESPSGDDLYYAHDHLFSPVALLESDADILNHAGNDAYGNIYHM